VSHAKADHGPDMERREEKLFVGIEINEVHPAIEYLQKHFTTRRREDAKNEQKDRDS
jgi:hypothetical protein